jgi:hypothetical protein
VTNPDELSRIGERVQVRFPCIGIEKRPYVAYRNDTAFGVEFLSGPNIVFTRHSSPAKTQFDSSSSFVTAEYQADKHIDTLPVYLNPGDYVLMADYGPIACTRKVIEEIRM